MPGAPDPRALLDLALRAAAAGAEVHRRGLGRAERVETKSSPTDMVSEVDREAERVIVGVLTDARPDDAILGEEATDRPGRSGVRWVIDPLDGTTNFLYGFPAFAVSIAAELDGTAWVAVVHDSANGRVYSAIRGAGASVDGTPLGARSHADLSTALLATGFLPHPEQRARQAEALRYILPRVRDIRRAGSAALDLCAVAAGRLDGYYEYGLGEWDVAAGALIATEAGARMAKIPVPWARGPLVVAATPALLDPLVQLLRDAGLAPGSGPDALTTVLNSG